MKFSVGDVVIKNTGGLWPVPAVAALRFAIGAVALFGLSLRREGPQGF